jgi:hypothetical protein
MQQRAWDPCKRGHAVLAGGSPSFGGAACLSLTYSYSPQPGLCWACAGVGEIPGGATLDMDVRSLRHFLFFSLSILVINIYR